MTRPLPEELEELERLVKAAREYGEVAIYSDMRPIEARNKLAQAAMWFHRSKADVSTGTLIAACRERDALREAAQAVVADAEEDFRSTPHYNLTYRVTYRLMGELRAALAQHRDEGGGTE